MVRALRALGYVVARQKGSHTRVTTQQNGENHEVIPVIADQERDSRGDS